MSNFILVQINIYFILNLEFHEEEDIKYTFLNKTKSRLDLSEIEPFLNLNSFPNQNRFKQENEQPADIKENEQSDEQKIEHIKQKFTDDRQPSSTGNCENNPHYKDFNSSTAFDNPDHPPNPKGPTNIDINLILDKVKDFDLNGNKFFARGSMTMVWCDPRLKFDPAKGTYLMQNDDVAVQELKYGRIWTPEIRFRNAAEPRSIDNIRIQVYNDGSVVQRESFVVYLMTNFNLIKIPFDTQEIKVNIGSLTWDTDQVKLIDNGSNVNFADNFQITEFEKKSSEQEIKTIKDKWQRRNQQQISAKFTVVRMSSLQIFKVLVPLFILIFVTSLIFTIPNECIQDRIDVFLDCILATVAQMIIVEEYVPTQIFFNYLNLAIFFAMLCMVQGIILCFTLHKIHLAGYENSAKILTSQMTLQQNILQILILWDLQVIQIWESWQGGFTSISWTFAGLAQMVQVCNAPALTKDESKDSKDDDARQDED